ncbi:hypothetical protein ABPG74_005912 [Tetrahymena malaccensis]
MRTENNFIINFLREENNKFKSLSNEPSEICKMQRDFYTKLFKNQATALTVFRCIDYYSQEIIQKMVRLSYHKNIDSKKQNDILKRLLDEDYDYQEFTKENIHLVEFDLVNYTEEYLIEINNKDFINAYLDIITYGLRTEIDFCKQKKNNMKDYSQLESKAKNQWKSICNQLMLMAQESNNAASQSQNKYSRLVMDVFRQILSIEQGKPGSGYQKYMEFILEDTNTQIDKILTLYCQKYSENYKISMETAVSFLLTLSNLDITKIYQNTFNNETTTFQPRELEFLNDLHSLGMVFKKQILKDRIAFYITPLLWQFCYRKIDIKTLNARITIETNFNVYVFIDQEDSSDQTEHIEKLLASFCDLHYKFPHLIVGQLSEQKTKEQFKKGLSARLLIQFFNKTSDPQMKKYLKDKLMNTILLTQIENIEKNKLDCLNLFNKTEENFSLIPDNIQQEIETWEREQEYQTIDFDNYNSDDDVKEDDVKDDDRLLDENYPYQEFTKGESHLAEFDLVNFREKTINNGFMNAYLDIVTCGLRTEIDFCKQKKNNMKDYSQLESKAKNQWKSICNQLMLMAQESNNAASQSQNKYSRLVMDVFRQILSIEQGKPGSGYQKYMEFILEDTNTQIDKILTLYCQRYSKNHNISVETAVSFLLTLSNLDITKIYQNTFNNETTTFQPRELEFLNDLHSLGMVFKKELVNYFTNQIYKIQILLIDFQQKDRIAFYITPVLWQFCYRKIDLKTLNAKITIETNFNVYAYIDQEDSSDQTEHIEKLLASFCDLHYKQNKINFSLLQLLILLIKRFPHLIVGQLSEYKTKEQFKNGLTARLLIQFFNKTSDPQMKKYLKDKQMNAILLTQVQNLQKKKLEFLNLFKKTEDNFSLIPDNIQQEIETWEREKDDQTRRDDNYNSDDDVKDKD